MSSLNTANKNDNNEDLQKEAGAIVSLLSLGCTSDGTSKTSAEKQKQEAEAPKQLLKAQQHQQQQQQPRQGQKQSIPQQPLKHSPTSTTVDVSNQYMGKISPPPLLPPLQSQRQVQRQKQNKVLQAAQQQKTQELQGKQQQCQKEEEVATDNEVLLDLVWNPRLGKWVGNKKQQEAWEKMYVRLLEYKTKHGHCDVAQNDKEDPKLGRWTRYQRYMNGKGLLSKYRQHKLNKVGFLWSLIHPKPSQQQVQEILAEQEQADDAQRALILQEQRQQLQQQKRQHQETVSSVNYGSFNKNTPPETCNGGGFSLDKTSLHGVVQEQPCTTMQHQQTGIGGVSHKQQQQHHYDMVCEYESIQREQRRLQLQRERIKDQQLEQYGLKGLTKKQRQDAVRGMISVKSSSSNTATTFGITGSAGSNESPEVDEITSSSSSLPYGTTSGVGRGWNDMYNRFTDDRNEKANSTNHRSYGPSTSCTSPVLRPSIPTSSSSVAVANNSTKLQKLEEIEHKIQLEKQQLINEQKMLQLQEEQYALKLKEEQYEIEREKQRIVNQQKQLRKEQYELAMKQQQFNLNQQHKQQQQPHRPQNHQYHRSNNNFYHPYSRTGSLNYNHF